MFITGLDSTPTDENLRNIGQVAHRLAEMQAEAEYGPSHERLLLQVQNLVMESVGWVSVICCCPNLPGQEVLNSFCYS